MNKIIKISTILIVTIGAIASFAPSFALAASQASFSSSGMFLVGNHANAGTYNWTSSLSNMHPGDQVAFKFTFLNNSSVTAIDAKSSFSATSNSNCIQVTGTIWAQNAPSVSQSVNICAASGYTISLSQSNASFGGVGDVAPGYGGIEYYATGLYGITGQGTVQNPTANLWAEYPNGTAVTQVPLGTAPYLHWTSTNASECHTLAGAGFSTGGATSGQDQVSALAGTTTFSIQCTNSSGGSVQANATVYVTNPPASKPTVNISANPTYVSSGGISIISWTSTNDTECHATQGAGFSTGGAVVGSDITSALYGDTTFSVSCSNSSGSSSDSVVVRVNNTPPPPVNNPTANISANPTSVNSGNTSAIQWSSTNASECHATGGPGFSTSGATSGSSVSSALTSTSIFSITCTNTSGGSASNSVTVYVNNTPPPSGSAPSAQTNSATGISQSSAVLNGLVNPNGASTSYWFEYGTSQSLGNTSMSQSAGSGNSGSNISATISGLNSNTTYYFRVDAQNSYGTTNGSILSFTTGTGGGGGGSAPTVQTGGVSNLSTNSVTVSGTVDPNALSTSYWFEYGTSQSLGSATAFQSAGSGNDSNIYTAGLSSLMNNTTYYYRIAAQNSVGTSYGSILNFTTGGGGDVGGCTAPFVSTSGVNSNYQNSAQLSGSVNPNNCATTYWFEYGINYWMGNMTAYQSLGSSNSQVNVNANISGLSYNTTYYYRAVAQNSGGTSYGNILSFQTSNQGGCTYGNCNYGNIPSVQTNSSSMSGNNSITFYGQVTPNNSDTYAWFVYGTNSNNLYSTTNQQYIGGGSSQQYYNQTAYNLSSGTTYYYQAVASNSNGTAYGQILNTSTGGGNYGTGAPTVITNSATYVYSSSALLNGQVDPNGAVTSGWFEYGPTTNLGSMTTNQAVGSGNSYSNISFALSGLSPNTTYYYRAAAQNNSGTAYGSILSFTTGSGGVIVTPKPPTTIVVTNNVGTGSGASCVILVPSLNVSELQAGNTFTYTVTYRNGCTYNLSNVYMKVILPPGTQFVSTNYPFFNRDANGISYNLGALPADFQSAVSIQGLVDSSVSAGNTLIFSSVLNFNDLKGRFQSISAYLTAVVGSGQTLGATVIGAFGALLGNWLFDLLLLIVLIFLIYWIFFRRVDSKEKDEDALEAKPFIANR